MQNADGTPHMTYYDAERQLSFVWDGRSTEIEVSVGGYGEPVRDVIDLMRFNPSMFSTDASTDVRVPVLVPTTDEPLVEQAHDWLQWFATICQLHIELKYAAKGK